MTEWRWVVGAEGRYEASSDGDVRSIPRRRTRGGILKTTIGDRGYKRVSIDRRGQDVHVLVATAFHGPRPTPEHECKHKSGDKMDCSAVNLEWGTASENRLDSVKHGTHANAAKEFCPSDHPYDEENTHIMASGERRCRKCDRLRQQRRALKRRAA
jgi:hypothetical protein